MQFIQHLAASGSAALLLGLALPAQAHICMEAPMSRVGPSCSVSSPQKPGPCGINTRSTKYIAEFKPGETITVTLNETVNHDSHYRIAFNPNGETFEDPTGIDDKSGKHPFVLIDGIKDESAARQSVEVTLPNVTCDKCTLQLIQVMYDKTGNGFGNDDIYYSCADIVLKGTPAASDAGMQGIVAPRPAPDASQEPLPPVQSADAGVTDAGRPPTSAGDADSSTASSGQADAGQALTDAVVSAEAEDDEGGGCTLAARDSRPHAGALGALLVLAALIHRRRRAS